MTGYIPQKFFFILFIKRVVKRAGPNVSIFQTNFSSFLSIELQWAVASVYVYLRRGKRRKIEMGSPIGLRNFLNLNLI